MQHPGDDAGRAVQVFFVEQGPAASRGAGVPDPAGWALKADRAGFMFRIADATLASNARRIFRRYLEAQVSDGSDLDGAELVFGELLGNVARHAPGSVDVRLRWNGRTGILEVSDRGGGYSVEDLHLPADDVESTRGLFLVSVFAADLRVRHDAGVTTTTVTLPVQRRLPDPPKRAPAA